MSRPKGKQSPFLRKLQMIGLQKLGTGDPRKVMMILRQVKKLTTLQIAELTGFTDEAVRYWLDEYGMTESQRTFPRVVLTIKNPKTGALYRSLREFFVQNVDVPFSKLGERTGFSGPTVAKYYERFIDQIKEEKGVS